MWRHDRAAGSDKPARARSDRRDVSASRGDRPARRNHRPSTAPTVAPTLATQPRGGTAPVEMPTYQPITTAPPDLPGDDQVEAGYFAFPKQLTKTVTDTPIKSGGEVNVMTWNVTRPIAPLESNTAWQEINRQVGATINVVNNVSNSDYRTKLATVVAGGELPDTLYIPASPGGQSAPFAQFPDFLERSAADLTPISAATPSRTTPTWPPSPLVPGRVHLPQQDFRRARLVSTGAWHRAMGPPGAVRREELERPKSTDEFKTLLRPSKTRTPMSMASARPSRAPTPPRRLRPRPVPDVLRRAQQLDRNPDGSLTRGFETDEYKAAMSYARDLVRAGLFARTRPRSTRSACEPTLLSANMLSSTAAG